MTSLVDDSVEAIKSKAAHTGRIGDGKDFCFFNVDEVIRIRTGEIGKEANITI